MSGWVEAGHVRIWVVSHENLELGYWKRKQSWEGREDGGQRRKDRHKFRKTFAWVRFQFKKQDTACCLTFMQSKHWLLNIQGDPWFPWKHWRHLERSNDECQLGWCALRDGILKCHFGLPLCSVRYSQNDWAGQFCEPWLLGTGPTKGQLRWE